jgi:hypothetical protein
MIASKRTEQLTLFGNQPTNPSLVGGSTAATMSRAGSGDIL